jgi:phage shock protein E
MLHLPKTIFMKHQLFFALLFFCFGFKSQTRLNLEEFKVKMKQPNVQILDVRTAKEVAEGKIEGAVVADYFSPKFLELVIEKLDKKKPVLIYCAAGGRSQSAMKDLKKAGFKEVYDLIGGFDGYKP